MRESVNSDFELLTNDAYRIRADVDALILGEKHFEATDGDVSLLSLYLTTKQIN